MSLRQRGQRSSESSKEGFSPYSSTNSNEYFNRQASEASAASAMSGMSSSSNSRMARSPPRPPLPRSSMPPSTPAAPFSGSFQGTPRATPSSSGGMMGYQAAPSTGGSHGSYYSNAGSNMASPPPATTTPMAGMGGATGTPSSTTEIRPPGTAYSPYSTPQHRGSFSTYPQTAPAAYGAGSTSMSSSPMGPRSLNFTDTTATSGASGGAMGSSHENPYQSQKGGTKTVSAASGVGGFGRVVMVFFLVACLTLSGTTIYFRSLVLRAQVELAELERQPGRKFGGGLWKNKKKDKKGFQWPSKDKKDDQKNPDRGGEDRKSRESRRNRERNKPENVDPKVISNLQKTKESLESQSQQIQAEFETLQKTYKTHNENLETLEQTKQDLLHKIELAEHEYDHSEEQMEKYQAMLNGRKELEELMVKREGALWKRIDGLRDKIARESRRDTEEWFGPGPHKVEFEMDYPLVGNDSNPETWKRVRKSFIIELAPLDLMPHTVSHFLQQVDYKLWDGCTLNKNAHHIFYFGPPPPEEENTTPESLQKFIDHGLDKVAFQEYNEQYPHSQWTIGYAGRPGGPDFYINKLDNTIIHGPGGQTNSNDLHYEADPCFGKVVEGMEVINEINKVPTDTDHGGATMYPVVITQAKILSDRVEPGNRLEPEELKKM